MVAFVLDTFNWDSFTRGISGQSPELVAALAQRINNLREEDPAFLAALPAKGAELASYLSKLFARDEWYADLGAQQRIDLDRVVSLIFDKPASKIVSARQVGQIDAFLIDFARGHLKFVGTGKHMRVQPIKPAPLDPNSELHAMGNRPYRFKEWNPAEAQEVNPFTMRKPVQAPSYSIHTPQQLGTLVGEIEKFDIESIPEPHGRNEFESQLLQPLRSAAQQKLALYVWQDY